MVKRLAPLFLLFLFSCANNRRLNNTQYETPPGAIGISDNLYFDESEVSNLGYLEYLWWTARVYGLKSNEYFSAFPDTTVWIKLDKVYSSFALLYLRHPTYREYPVVGINYTQALKFTEWRANRVMEFIAIREGLIRHIPSPHKDSVFTIEKFFNCEYKTRQPNFLEYYPEYSLPDSITYLKAIKFADTFNKKNFKPGSKKWCGQNPIQVNCYESIKFKNDTLPYGPNPITLSYCRKNHKSVIAHLKGNVREITANPKFTFGGSFKDSCKSELFLLNDSVNAYTGFRNVCRWKKWTGIKKP